MSVTAACVLGIVIGLCAGVFLMGLMVMSRSAEDEANVKRGDEVIHRLIEEIRVFDEVIDCQVLSGFVDRLQAYKSLVASLQKTLLSHSTNG